MVEDFDPMSRAFGALEACVENLTRQWAKQDLAATEGRRALYDKFDELRDELQKAVTELKGDLQKTATAVGALATEMAEIKPAVKRFEGDRQRAVGRRGALALVWSALIAGAGFIGWAVNEYVHWPSSKH